jgi:hypothetical protein
VGPRSGLDAVEPYRDSNSNFSIVQPVASNYTDYDIPTIGYVMKVVAHVVVADSYCCWRSLNISDLLHCSQISGLETCTDRQTDRPATLQKCGCQIHRTSMHPLCMTLYISNSTYRGSVPQEITCLTCVRMIPGSNLGLNIDYPRFLRGILNSN